MAWERNVFEAGLVGAALFCAARWLGSRLIPSRLLAGIREQVGPVLPIPYAGSFFAAIALGLLLVAVMAMLFSMQALSRLAVENHGNDLEKLLFRALEEHTPVMLSMKNLKVYVGYVLSTPSLHERDRYTKLLTVKSGFRTKDRLEVEWTTDYRAVLESVSDEIERAAREGEPEADEILGIDWQIFGTVLPLDEVSAATLYDEGVFQRFAATRGGAARA